MKNSISDGFGFALRAFGFVFLELPIKSLVRFVSSCLFAAEAILIIVPCLFLEILFMTKRTPFHWIADKIDKLSEKMDEISDPINGFRIF